MKVLLFDPTPAYRIFVGEVAKWLGHDPLCTKSGGEILDLLPRENPDLVILAVDSGIEPALEVLRSLLHSDWTGIVIVSADGDEPLENFRKSDPRLTGHPKVIFMLKPWTSGELDALLDRTKLGDRLKRFRTQCTMIETLRGAVR